MSVDPSGDRWQRQQQAACLSWRSLTFTQTTASRKAVIDRALAAGGAHSIKFTEACLREYALNPTPIYLMAAYDVAERVGEL